MSDRAQAERHLVEADRHIAEAEERIQHQRQRVQKLVQQRMPTKGQEKLLATMMDSFSLMKHHRDLILDAIRDSGKFS